MDKRTITFVGSSILAIAVLSISTVLYFRNRNDVQAIEPPPDFVVGGEVSSSPSSAVDLSKYDITPVVKAGTNAEVIEDMAVSNPEDDIPTPEVTETSDGSGGIVQTPNWEAQKELAPDTDISNPESKPEYVKPETSQPSAPSNPSPSTPKNGDTKTIDGDKYTYLEGFGWVKDGNGGTTRTIEVGGLSGNKVGY